MRISTIIFLYLAISSCKAQTPPSLDTIEQQEQTSKSVSEVRYKRQSRGFRSLLSFNKNELLISKAGEAAKRFKISKKDWDSITYYSNRIALQELKFLKAPTDYRTYDGAAAAELTLIVNTTSWVSSTFDDGYPPKDIQALVNKLLSIEKAALKTD